MLKSLKSRLTYANVMVTLLAIVVLGGGTAWALAVNTVGPRQIKPNAVRSADIRDLAVKRSDIANNAINSAKVANGSLLSEDFAPGVIPGGGGQGGQGPAGPQGEPGQPGATNVVVRPGPVESVPAGGVGVVTASCNPGERVTGGGNGVSGSGSNWEVAESFPTPATEGATPTGWRVDAQNTGGTAQNLLAIVICASP